MTLTLGRLTTAVLLIVGAVVAGSPADATVEDVERPGRATDMTGSVTPEGWTRLRWTGATDDVGVVGYEIHRSVDGGDFDLLFTTWWGGIFTDRSVEPEREYRYYVRAVDAAGNVGWRNGIVRISTSADEDFQLPTVAIGNDYGSNTSTSIGNVIRADDNVGVVALTLTWRDRDGVGGTVELPADTTEHTTTGLRPSTKYWFEITARDAAGNTATYRHSSTTRFDPAVQPTVPTGMTAEASPDGVRLAWDPATSPEGIGAYRVYRFVGDDTGTARIVATVAEPNHVDTDVDEGVRYGYYVRAVSAESSVTGWRNGVVHVTAG